MTLSFLPGQIVQVLNLNLEEYLPKLREKYKKVVTFSKLSDLYQDNVFSDDGNLIFIVYDADVPLRWERYCNNVTLLWDPKQVDLNLPIVKGSWLEQIEQEEYQKFLKNLTYMGTYDEVSVDTLIQFHERVIVPIGLITKNKLSKGKLFFLNLEEQTLIHRATLSREVSIASLMMLMGEVEIVETKIWISKLARITR